ncbi:hypothetical protein [Lactococcus lactis]|uniref:DUF5067 domain-containing protein n=1 Tax=Lactococcus lactis TaxID=1358 RepID=A0AAW5TVD6_9LACT|nr:hypothetical protein [Lactococcus lactis]MCW2282237.1 hypothetical protein [Lactococcus lactis]
MKKFRLDTRKKKALAIIISILLVFIVIFGIWKYQQSKNPANNEVEQGTVLYNSKYKSNAPGNLVFPAYTQDITVKRDVKEIPIVLANPKVNKNVYFKYKLSVTKENSKKNINLGETKLIEAGKALNKLPISQSKLKTLSIGKHKCRIDVFAYTYNEKNNEKIKLNQAYWDVNFTIE